MFESFILGAVQGVAEWLPISSEAMIILVKNNFFPSSMNFSEMISFAIFLHLGTLLAVVVYYWKKILALCRQFFCYQSQPRETKQYLHFIIIATFVSGGFGYFLFQIVERYESWFHNEFMINMFVAILLCITAALLYVAERQSQKTIVSLSLSRALITGLFQGVAAIPGISRSGSTVAGMGLLGIDKERALELSFILSIPIVLLANIILNSAELIHFSGEHFIALGSAFIFGLVTIHGLLAVVKRLRFSYFVGFFALLLFIINIFFLS